MIKTRRAALAALLVAAFAGCSSSTEVELGTIEGEVQDNVGNAVSGITFRLTRDGRTPKTATSTTDGLFVFPRVEPGDWKIEFTPPLNYTLASAQQNPIEVKVFERRTTDVQINLNRRTTAPPPGGGGPIVQGTH